MKRITWKQEITESRVKLLKILPSSTERNEEGCAYLIYYTLPKELVSSIYNRTALQRPPLVSSHRVHNSRNTGLNTMSSYTQVSKHNRNWVVLVLEGMLVKSGCFHLFSHKSTNIRNWQKTCEHLLCSRYIPLLCSIPDVRAYIGVRPWGVLGLRQCDLRWISARVYRHDLRNRRN